MYKKIYDANGILTNPITKDSPFVNAGTSRSQRRAKQRPFNNSNKLSNVVTRIGTTKQGRGIFLRYIQEVQSIGRKRIVHFKSA